MISSSNTHISNHDDKHYDINSFPTRRSSDLSKVTPGESVTLAGRNISSSGTRIFLGDYELSFSLVGIDTVSDYTSRYEIAVEVIRFSVPYDIDAGLKALSVRKPSGELFNFPEIDVVS